MDITAMIAANTRRIREQKKLTLEAAASLTGVSRSMLAQIEKGEVNPTISVLWKIANGYKVSFTSLAENRGAPVRVVRGSELQPLLEDAGRYQNYPIFPFDEGKLFETYRIVIQPGGSLAAQPHLSGAEEYITVFVLHYFATYISTLYMYSICRRICGMPGFSSIHIRIPASPSMRMRCRAIRR